MIVKLVYLSLWSSKTDAETLTLLEPGNGPFFFAFLIKLHNIGVQSFIHHVLNTIP